MTDKNTATKQPKPADIPDWALWMNNNCMPPELRPKPQMKWITGPCQILEHDHSSSEPSSDEVKNTIDTESDAITQRMNACREKYGKMSLKDLKEETELILKKKMA